MGRLLVHVEGQTEEEFVKRILSPYLYGVGFRDVSARLLGRQRSRGRRGGIRGWPETHHEIHRHLLYDRRVLATTFVDYYGLPSGGDNGWPGRDDCRGKTTREAGRLLVEKMADSFQKEYGAEIARRFIPFVAMHEFEGLLFSDPEAMATGMEERNLIGDLKKIRSDFPTPEDINEGPETAPSKRIANLLPGYQKVLHGNLAAEEVGIDRMKENCAVFSDWISRLEDAVA